MDMFQRASYVRIGILLALFFFVYYQWDKEKDQLESSESIVESLLFSNFARLSDEYDAISKTLEGYDSTYSQRERDLYFNSIDQHIRSLNSIGTDFTFLVQASDLKDILLYEDYIYPLEEYLANIKNGSITNQNSIHSASQIIGTQNKQISNFVYGEVGVDGLNSEEGVQDLLDILNELNEQVEGIFK
ncbi:hypothetical protein A8F94_00935 [Bacillus sp. FJAT-27225]|uniref:hypothetical protein n=1 Tax=Bacillus sp. FJAT-27225 TaxID=1743144 RepID=UPI00080C2820|nr:hypothetical protein [Bacillus sp. FJAT-27225]OCA90485.1 hypothetical protein A8F94_00935 [Bacillus sp. FJAT-27225]